MRFTIVDVFAESEYAGNQLAVVTDAVALDEHTMQAIAREMNFSETTFVVSRTASSARVRIFTPGGELPFAGHPTLGTAWVLGRARNDFTLELGIGPVTVTFDGDDAPCWMTPPNARFGPVLDRGRAAAVVSLAEASLHPSWPATFVDLGPRFLFVPLRTLADVRAARLDVPVRAAMLDAELPADAIFCFAPEGYSSDADFSARLFFEANGIREDPATGSANAGLAGYLRARCPTPLRVVVEQGFEIHRPSRIYLDVRDDTFRVGGKVRLVAEGHLS
jgi:trans-2,3-dihydro-3-hydroxyanthranilate isomerase